MKDISEDKRGSINALNLIIGFMLIGGGILYLLGQNLLGAVVAGFGVFIEILLNWLKTL